jgi:hypothetical protein
MQQPANRCGNVLDRVPRQAAGVRTDSPSFDCCHYKTSVSLSKGSTPSPGQQTGQQHARDMAVCTAALTLGLPCR